MKCWRCYAEVIGRNREKCTICDVYGPKYNKNPCHKMDPLVCVKPAGHSGSDADCDDDEALMQFYSGGDEGRYV